MADSVYTVESIEPGLWRIKEGHVYMYLIEGEEASLLVDTGLGGGDLKGLIQSLTKKPLEVLNTHCHGDHTGGNRQFDWVYLHPSDWAAYEKTPEGGGVDLETVEQEDVIDLGGIVLEVVHIPGHTPGSVALLESEKRWLFPGDSLQEGPIYMFMDTCSLRAQLESLKKLSTLEFDRAFPCHNREEVDKSWIEPLVACGEKILAGDLEGEPAELGRGPKCKIYRDGKVSYYYN